MFSWHPCIRKPSSHLLIMCLYITSVRYFLHGINAYLTSLCLIYIEHIWQCKHVSCFCELSVHQQHVGTCVSLWVCMLTSCPGVWPHHSVWSPRGDRGAWPASWRLHSRLCSHWPECQCCRAPNAPDCPNHTLLSQTARLWGWHRWGGEHTHTHMYTQTYTHTHKQVPRLMNGTHVCSYKPTHLKLDGENWTAEHKTQLPKHMFIYTQTNVKWGLNDLFWHWPTFTVT